MNTLFANLEKKLSWLFVHISAMYCRKTTLHKKAYYYAVNENITSKMYGISRHWKSKTLPHCKINILHFNYDFIASNKLALKYNFNLPFYDNINETVILSNWFFLKVYTVAPGLMEKFDFSCLRLPASNFLVFFNNISL